MDKHSCKYCGKELSKVLMPKESDWGVDYFFICMDDDCPYYVRGWDWMKEQYQVKASYRYKYDPWQDHSGPIPIKDPSDMKDWIIHKFQEQE